MYKIRLKFQKRAMLKNIVAIWLLCFSLLPINTSKALSILSDFRIAPEIYGGGAINSLSSSFFKKKSEDFFLNSQKDDNLKTSLCFGLGLMFGYDIFGIAIPEIGVRLQTARSFELGGMFAYEEKFVEIPIRLNLGISIIPFILKIRFVAGYKINIPYSATLTVKDKAKLKTKGFGNINETKESMNKEKNFPSHSGDVTLGFGLTFPLDIYVNFIANIPVDIFLNSLSGKWDEIKNKKIEKYNPNEPEFIMFARYYSSPVFEVQVGINLMKVLL